MGDTTESYENQPFLPSFNFIWRDIKSINLYCLGFFYNFICEIQDKISNNFLKFPGVKFVNHISSKGVISKIHKELIQFNSKRTTQLKIFPPIP